MDFNAYAAPGIYVSQIDSPLVSTIDTPIVIPAFIGKALGYQVATEDRQVTGTTAISLTNLGVDQTNIVVKDQVSGVIFTKDTDYTVGTDSTTHKTTIVRKLTHVTSGSPESIVLTNLVAMPLGHGYPEATTVVVKSSDGVTTYTENTDYTIDYNASTIVRKGSGIGSGATVKVSYDYCGIKANSYIRTSYQYQSSQYYDVFKLSTFDDVRSIYGAPFVSSGVHAGEIQSELSLAAYFAFANGAKSIYCVAIATEGATPTIEEMEIGLEKLRGQDEINVIVPLYGGYTFDGNLSSFINSEAVNGHMCRGILGRDGTSTLVDTTTLRSQAGAINSERICLVNTSTIKYFNPISASVQTLPGQYVAAACAGRAASQSPQIPLTRKSLLGFYDIDETKSPSVIKEEARAGLLCISMRYNTMQVFHGVTTFVSSLSSEKRELSVGLAADYMIMTLTKTLDGLIGTPIYADTPMSVKGQVASVLEYLKGSTVGIIADYQNIGSRQSPTNQTVIEVKFEYMPVYPLNWIAIYFAVNTQTGELSLSPVSS